MVSHGLLFRMRELFHLFQGEKGFAVVGTLPCLCPCPQNKVFLTCLGFLSTSSLDTTDHICHASRTGVPKHCPSPLEVPKWVCVCLVCTETLCVFFYFVAWAVVQVDMLRGEFPNPRNSPPDRHRNWCPGSASSVGRGYSSGKAPFVSILLFSKLNAPSLLGVLLSGNHRPLLAL
jgi:hypothetical protein